MGFLESQPFDGCRASNLVHEIAKFDFHGFREAHQRMNTYRLFAALHLPQVNWMQVGLLGQRLLAQSGSLAVSADGFADDSLIRDACCHAALPNRNGRFLTQYTTFYFSLLHLFGSGVRNGAG